MKTLLLSTLCLVLATRSALGDEPTAQEKAAANFTFEKVKLGISLMEFKKLYPKAELSDKHSLPKLTQICYLADATAASGCFYFFLDDKIYQMRIVYTQEKLKKIGGWSVVLERLIEKFGKFEEGMMTLVEKPLKVEGIWVFPKVNRVAGVNIDSSSVVLEIADIALGAELENRKKKAAKTGFDD